MSDRKVTIVDGLNPFSKRLERRLRRERLKVCESCDKFTSLQRCTMCGCFMPLKVTLPDATCPLGKWSQ